MLHLWKKIVSEEDGNKSPGKNIDPKERKHSTDWTSLTSV